MATLDIFNDDAFSMVELTSALDKVPFKPQLLGDLGIFTPRPIRTEHVAIEKRDNVLSLIPTSERGEALEERERAQRDIRNFNTRRIAKGDTIRAHEVQNIRQFGRETELMQVQQEVSRRMGRIREDVELTHEHMRLGAVSGIVLDADGSTLDNWFTNWGVSQAAEIDFALDTDGTKVRGKCQEVIRAMRTNAKGAWSPATQVHALCGDSFFDKLIDHPNVRDTFKNWAAAAELRDNMAFMTFPYGGIFFHNYRGTDDFDDSGTEGTEIVGVASTKAKFFPVNAPGVFEVAFSPAETFDFANTPGQEVYAMTIPDRDRNAWVRVEEYSYPLFYCTRPEMLQRAKEA